MTRNMWPQSPVSFITIVAVVAVWLVTDWLNELSIQIVGPVLYPIERLLNAAFFPEVMTPLRPNGTALLVLVPTLALFAAIAFVARGALRVLMRIIGLFRGRH